MRWSRCCELMWPVAAPCERRYTWREGGEATLAHTVHAWLIANAFSRALCIVQVQHQMHAVMFAQQLLLPPGDASNGLSE